MFFDLCDESGSGAVRKGEFFDLLKKNLINPDEKNSMKTAGNTIIFIKVDNIWKLSGLNFNQEITLYIGYN